MGSRGRGFKAPNYADTSVSAAQKNQLKADITGDTSIDDETRAELLTAAQGVGVQSDVPAIGQKIAAARAGLEPVFKGRKLFQGMRESAAARPGRSSTILTR